MEVSSLPTPMQYCVLLFRLRALSILVNVLFDPTSPSPLDPFLPPIWSQLFPCFCYGVWGAVTGDSWFRLSSDSNLALPETCPKSTIASSEQRAPEEIEFNAEQTSG